MVRTVSSVIAAVILAAPASHADEYPCPDERSEELRMKGLWARVEYDQKQARAKKTLKTLQDVVAQATRPNDKEALELACNGIVEILVEEGLAESRADALNGCRDDALEQYVKHRDESAGKEETYLPIVRVAPVYPEAAFDQKLSGQVIVELTVTREGRVESPHVVESSNEIFNEAALSAVADFRYKPRKEGRKTVEVTGVRAGVSFDYDRTMRDRLCR